MDEIDCVDCSVIKKPNSWKDLLVQFIILVNKLLFTTLLCNLWMGVYFQESPSLLKQTDVWRTRAQLVFLISSTTFVIHPN